IILCFRHMDPLDPGLDVVGSPFTLHFTVKATKSMTIDLLRLLVGAKSVLLTVEELVALQHAAPLKHHYPTRIHLGSPVFRRHGSRVPLAGIPVNQGSKQPSRKVGRSRPY